MVYRLLSRRKTKSSDATVFRPCSHDRCRDGWIADWEYDAIWQVNIERFSKCQCRLDYELALIDKLRR
jgi:hypothetical protein